VRAVVQRVSEARVSIDGRVVSEIGAGLLVLVGVGKEDGPQDAEALAEKIVTLRIFPDEAGHMNRSVQDTGGALLAVSQFTLFGDARRGRRPSFIDAAAPADAEPLYRLFSAALARSGLAVGLGVFGADMEVGLTNDGPVTLLLDSRKLF
jgi:D-tyrosyl-tRNA(Tyr) deacylase